ncbi:peptide ABC transporter permease [Clostridia bacterium]|nr:peptide ABC transporter permease [Clostridia bacterium]
MRKYFVRRLAEMLLTLFLIATATFFLLEAVPGNPLTARAEKLPQNVKDNLYRKYGLDKPMLERYFITMKGIATGNFGESFVHAGQTVQTLIRDRLPVSARLGIQQMVLGVTAGLVLGILAAMKRGTFIDYLVIVLSVLLISVPSLVFGLMLQKIFTGSLKWFPTIGWPEGNDLWFGGWKYTVLPTLTGCFAYIAFYSRLLKASMLDVIGQDYVLTAESKGLSQFAIIRKHILRNAFIPVVTQLPMSIAMCITGSFFIENIYAIPGIGQYYVTSVNNQDLSILMGETVILAAMYMVVLFITDILYIVVDPRIKISGMKR